MLNDNLTTRYNPETDHFECFYNGVWKQSISADIQTFNLFKSGVLASGYSFIGSCSLNANTFTHGITDNKLWCSVKYENGCWLCPIDLTNYSSIKINAHCTLTSDHLGSFYVTNNTQYPLTLVSSVTLTATPTNYTIDVSSLDGIYYVGIYTGSRDGNATTTYCSLIELIP